MSNSHATVANLILYTVTTRVSSLAEADALSRSIMTEGLSSSIHVYGPVRANYWDGVDMSSVEEFEVRVLTNGNLSLQCAKRLSELHPADGAAAVEVAALSTTGAYAEQVTSTLV